MSPFRMNMNGCAPLLNDGCYRLRMNGFRRRLHFFPLRDPFRKKRRGKSPGAVSRTEKLLVVRDRGDRCSLKRREERDYLFTEYSPHCLIIVPFEGRGKIHKGRVCLVLIKIVIT